MKKYTDPPQLNVSRRFPDNMMSAHALTLKAKQGDKGGKKVASYAIPAFNITTIQGINAAFDAFETLGSSGLLALSNSALKHFSAGDPISGLEIASAYIQARAKRSSIKVATHLDHGDYTTESGRKVVQGAVQHLTSVMADNSTDHANKVARSLEENIAYTREVVDMAHPLGVSVEGELGVLAGEEDEDTKSEFSTYTNPDEFEQFITETGVLMVAPTIGTMHGPNKGKPGTKVKLNIELAHELLKIADQVQPETIFVAHGASTLYPQVVDYAVEQLEAIGSSMAERYGQTWKNFVGTDWEQIQGLIGAGFAKINTDTENRQTFLSALLGAINENSAKIDIRWYDKKTTEALTQSYLIKLIMAENYGVWHEPKINVDKFKFDLNTSLADALAAAK
ncbi:MAG: class II fructose-bisphosphate aldolase [Candidatus Marinimicrobia bacterium]|nr:class II fructose-bisphosphate aldolase [Candidatus Neomarinimicrobiota bacterium]MCF7850541.1 class II fructose-bisphosphate aldolase [Candidatus Neomarinimicrobiota bacterium]MCF7904115.1 class II fructose-bisphosphate aldolase [Candidatus Neomarinimicrobiota bacterium]